MSPLKGSISHRGLYPGCRMGLIGIVAITRLAMHPMWKRGEQENSD